MKSSEKLLAGLLGGSLGLFVVVPFLWGAFRGPVADKEKELASAQKKYDDTEVAKNLSQSKSRDLILYKQQSLSSNTAHGVLAYQQWLSDLAELVAGFKNPEVARDRVIAGRDSQFVAVRMRVTTEGTLDQLREFLFRFHRANVLHRVAALTIESLDNSSRPKLSIKLTAEALSLRDADDKGATLFPRTSLKSLDGKSGDNTRLLTVESRSGFPDVAPFEIRIGGQYATVTSISDDGLLIESPKLDAISKKPGEIVEYSPINPKFADVALTAFDTLIANNPFAKPAPYLPRLDLIGEKTVDRGKTLELSAKVSGIDTGGEEAVWQVTSELPAGMTLESGKLKWAPPADLAAGSFKVSLRATGGGLREPLESSFDLALKDVNNAPALTLPSDVVAVVGKPLSFKVSATDVETAPEKLRFAAGTGAPEGLTVNAETGEVTWTPAASVVPGTVQLPIAVSDDGSPAQTTTVQLAVTVQDNKAQFTYLTGSVAADDEKQAWLYDRSTNSRVVLKEGQPMKYAGFDAIVLNIGYDFVLFKQKNDTLRVEVGQNLGEAKVIASVAPTDAANAPIDSADAPARPDAAAGSPDADSTAAGTTAADSAATGTTAPPPPTPENAEKKPESGEAAAPPSKGQPATDESADESADSGTPETATSAASETDAPGATKPVNEVPGQ